MSRGTMLVPFIQQEQAYNLLHGGDLFFDDFLYLLFKGRELGLHYIPDDVDVYTEVLMDEDVPESGYLLPLDGRVPQAHVIGYFLGRLAYYFKVSYDGIEGPGIAFQPFKVHPGSIIADFGDSVEDIVEIYLIVPGHGQPLS